VRASPGLKMAHPQGAGVSGPPGIRRRPAGFEEGFSMQGLPFEDPMV